SIFCTFADKVIYSSPNFDPKVFLSWVHKDTSAADLEAGAPTLKTDLKGRTQQKKLLVKENFDCFVSCKTTIDDIESKLRQIEEDPEGAGKPACVMVQAAATEDSSCAKELQKDGTSNLNFELELDSLSESENLEREMSSLKRQSMYKRKLDSSVSQHKSCLKISSFKDLKEVILQYKKFAQSGLRTDGLQSSLKMLLEVERPHLCS
ncbi:hypothetical protein ACJX0J_018788, partial [Zea mays]